MGCTQGEWPGETLPDHGCSGTAVARVNAAFVGRVQAGPSSSASGSDTPTGAAVTNVPGVSVRARRRHPARSGLPGSPFTPEWCSVGLPSTVRVPRMAADLVGLCRRCRSCRGPRGATHVPLNSLRSTAAPVSSDQACLTSHRSWRSAHHRPSASCSPLPSQVLLLRP